MRHVRNGGGRVLPLGAVGAGLFLAVFCGARPADAALFGSLKQLNTNAKFDKGDDYQPRLATDDQGNWVAVWSSKDMLYYNALEANIGTDADILVQRSADNGKTWTGVAPLNNDAFGDGKFDDAPALATDKAGIWLAVWDGDGGTTLPSIGVDGDLLIARSEDNGATWTDPVPFNTNAETDGPYDYDTSVDLATDENGNWIAVWFSRHNFGGVGDDFDILTARSSDNGATWSDPVRLNNNAWGDSGDDRFPRIATDTQGNWVTVWESNDWLGGEKAPFDWDIMVSRSSENGALWSDPKRLNSDGAADIVHDARPSIATDRLGNWVTAWVSSKKTWSDADIYVSRSTSNGVNWTVKVPLHSSAATDKEDDLFPWVATDRQGTWAVAWVTGASVEGMNLSDLLYSVSASEGALWTAPVPLNSNAATDTGLDYDVTLAVDDERNWIAAWRSDDGLGGKNLAHDDDILITWGRSGILVKWPNKEVIWTCCAPVTVRWDPGPFPGSTVDIELWRNGDFVRALAVDVPNDGRERCQLDPSDEPGDGYKIRILNTADRNDFDESDVPFVIEGR